MSELDLDAIEARARAATPGPWEFHDEDIHRNPWVTRKIVRDNEPYHELNVLKVRMARHARDECCWPPTSTDAEFIAHARTDVPALVSRVRELEAIIRRVAEYTVSDRTIIRVAGELQDILGDELPRGLS
ncbi:hypothetical protein SEA_BENTHERDUNTHAT_93 [Gordonia phage BENtherdunthat]|uniref:Uncharacterized protein n=1 Tax=Gordonia phage BENtherdunthat TaxID=2047830 RepID=A0A2H4PF46_9CAUD|nr:hypothetical protein HOS44_gp093 [Gordonia phage BENtherdunthat]ATW60863.1 hypothetical protein SEA_BENTHERDUNTHAT_93 [Gordonia phage BENtherdunthat]